MKKISICITNQDTKEEEIIDASFTQEEWTILNDYKLYADELYGIRLIKEGFNSNIKLSYKRDKGVEIQTNLPDWEDVIVFLHKYRPFGLKDEPTYFYKVTNIISKNIENNYFRKFIKKQRNFFCGKSMQNQIIIKRDNIVINSEKILDKWLNAYEYHRDKEKQKFIEKINKIMPEEFSQAIFVCLLIDKGKAIGNIGTLIGLLMNELDELNLKA